ncbi:TPA: type-F conjugative transfer system mating-pair stabilization protein TraN [Legionella pneumophila]|nr:type-F conjugative transfer system mating-pair stabilization protein TraN [Legionella pneumophila]HBD7410336.1 type-F conjugative transfer system mating-pair stabilization protein TraN [Legionella pneumophila]HBD9405529.1 type-F conjugative transfer system mating-pair stabilization protein TraN [Legionella pneumophila]HBI2968758.1 type-F conjugative transfer system mating-pair stabilization protein TraN [Legionella pneumophila]
MKRIPVILAVIFSTFVYADNLKDAYQEGKELAKSHARESVDLLKNMDVSQFPGYQENLSQQNYYEGVTQKSTTLEADGDASASDSMSGMAIREGFSNRGVFHINPNSENMQRLHNIAEHGDEIMQGKNTDKTSCSLKPQQCQYTWQEKTCLTSGGSENIACSKRLHIDITPYKTEAYTLNLHRGYFNAVYTLDINLLKTNTCPKTLEACYTLNQGATEAPQIVLPPDCAMIRVSVEDPQGYASVIQTASCSNPSFKLKVGKCLYYHCTVPSFHTVSVTVEIFHGKEYWDNRCASLESRTMEGICHIKEPFTCTEPNQTRIIGETPYTRACWKERAVFSCGGGVENTCDPLIAAGCEQTASTCVKNENARCSSFQQTFQCPVNQCTNNQLICGEDAFCLDGSCESHDYEPAGEDDFKKAVSVLSAASEGSKDFDGKANYVFQGQLLECSNLMLGVKNCCRDSGWGIDLNLAHCKDYEKKLGKARENKLVVATGEYCYKRRKIPGGSYCEEHRQTYCVFQSKLARIVQEQGRRDQLHIGFGTGQGSNCAGITPAQMQLIKFENINFSEFYADVKNKQKQPDYQKTAEGIGQRISDFYEQGDANA